MKQKLTYILALLCTLASCEQDELTYQGPDHIQWADTLTVLPVIDNDSVFDIMVSAMHTSDIDRNVAVELLADKSNARQGYHFDILNHTAVIPAGELTAKIRVRGYADKLAVTDSLGFIMRLVIDQKDESPIYGTDTKVMLQKACRFNINDFIGYAVVESSWIYNYMPTIESRLIRVDADPKKKNRIILRDLYYDKYDVTLDLTSDNILTPDLHFDDQVFAPTVEAFGTIYGNGKIMMTELDGYLSYYSSCERFLIFYSFLYVEDVGTVGNFVHVLEYVSKEEAERLIREGVNHSKNFYID